MSIKHFGQHDESCFACKIKSVSFAASAMPTRKPQVASGPWKNDKELDRDRDAFKAMRQQGIQPKSLKGAADLQDRASTQREIETGKIIGDRALATRVESTVKELAQK